MAEIVLLGSVFLPRLVSEPLERELRRRGHRVSTVVPQEAACADAVLTAYRAGCGAADRRPVVVAHSNAGLYVPALAAAGAISGALFMDAIVPEDSAHERPVMPVELRAWLVEKAEADSLPPWTRWWPPADVAALFPGDEVFVDVDAATPRIPLSYAHDAVGVPAGWTAGLAGAFLGLSDAYAEDAARARALGWPTRALNLGHLGHLLDPAAVAREVDGLLEQRSRR